jgi:hypothetical protein
MVQALSYEKTQLGTNSRPLAPSWQYIWPNRHCVCLHALGCLTYGDSRNARHVYHTRLGDKLNYRYQVCGLFVSTHPSVAPSLSEAEWGLKVLVSGLVLRLNLSNSAHDLALSFCTGNGADRALTIFNDLGCGLDSGTVSPCPISTQTT